MHTIFYFILILFAFSKSTSIQLKHVIVLFRHGDRAPITFFPNDRNQENMWPNGKGQLTDIGIRQQFALGQWLRIRYKNFLNAKYDREEICVKSTNVDRTIMSAQSNLAGLYHCEDNQVIPGLIWRPIPVYLFPRTSEVDMLPFKCDVYINKVKEIYETQFYQSLSSKYNKTFEAMKRFIQRPYITYEELMDVFDNAFCQKTHNMTLDSWITKEIYSDMFEINDVIWKMMYDDADLGRLSGGLFLNEIIGNLKVIVKDENSRKKFQMYSAHDTSLSALMSAIGIYDGVLPPYAACFIIELRHKPINDENPLQNFILQFFYKTETTFSQTIVEERKLVGCKSYPCTLQDFIDYTKPRTITLKEYEELIS